MAEFTDPEGFLELVENDDFLVFFSYFGCNGSWCQTVRSPSYSLLV